MHSYYSQLGTILRWLKDCWPQKVSFFMKGRYFAWYKAGTRITDLCREWLVVHSWDEKWENWQTFAIYSLTEAGQDYKIPKPTLSERIKHNFNL